MARQTDIRLRRSAVSGSVPTTSNLNLGELALNTADGKVYMKKSVGGTDSIVEVGSGAIASSFIAYEYTATSNQTTFSGSDNYSNTLSYNTGTPPVIQVFMNGILLDEGSSADYTGTNGTSVVLTTGADAGDLIQIHAYKSDVNVVSNLSFSDNQKVQFGDSNDLQIFHDGSHSEIREQGTGDLRIRGNSVWVLNSSGQNQISAAGGVAKLYNAGNLKLATTSTGVQTTGTVNVNGAYALPTSDGSAGQALVTNGSGVLSFATVSGGAVTSMSDTDGDTKIQFEESSDEDIIRLDTGGVERVRVGVDSSSDSTLEIVRTGVPASRGQLTFNGSGLITDVTSGYHSLIVRNAGSEHFRVRSNGNVGIGESSPGQKLQVNGNIRADGHYYVGGQIVIDSNRRILAADGAANVPYITFAADTNTGLYRPGTDILGFSTAGSERMRIDSSGNLLVGTSTVSLYNSNSEVGSRVGDGVLMVNRSGLTPAYFNRLSNDGNIIDLRKDGTSVGSISVSNFDLTIGSSASGHKGLRFGSDWIAPITTNLALEDNTTDLGLSGARFKDLYLSGTANVGIVSLKDVNNNGVINALTSGAKLYYNAHDAHIWQRQGSEKARIDSSGNLLVGTTDSSVWNNGASGNTGTVIESDGTIQLAKSNNVTAYLNRLNSDGDIVSFRKNGSGAGSIGSHTSTSTNIYIGSVDAGLYFDSTNNRISPYYVHNNSLPNGGISLGGNSNRFQNLYLAGTAHIGHAVIDDYAVNTSATSAAQVDTFAAATFRTARYTIQITNTTDSTYHVTELLLIHDGTTPSITEYGTIFTGSAAEATFDADIVSGNVRLLATPASTDTMQFKVVRHSILV